MARRAAKPRPVTPAEIKAACKALGLNVPVRAAERQGAQIVLHTRNGDFAWSPKAPPRHGKDESPPQKAQGGEKSGAGSKPAPAKGAKQ